MLYRVLAGSLMESHVVTVLRLNMVIPIMPSQSFAKSPADPLRPIEELDSTAPVRYPKPYHLPRKESCDCLTRCNRFVAPPFQRPVTSLRGVRQLPKLAEHGSGLAECELQTGRWRLL